MVIILIIGLYLIEIFITLSQVGIAVSTKVSQRAIDLGTTITIAESKGIRKKLKTKKLSKTTKDTLLTTGETGVLMVNGTVKRALEVVRVGAKYTLKGLKFIVKTIRRLLIVVLGVVLVVDIVVLFLITSAVSAYLLLYGVG